MEPIGKTPQLKSICIINLYIAQGVDAFGNKDEGAGDQGIMLHTLVPKHLMPAPISFASHCNLSRVPDMLTRTGLGPTPKAT